MVLNIEYRHILILHAKYIYYSFELKLTGDKMKT